MYTFQQKLKAPKSQHNSFGGYRYRSCEDIVEAVKPILAEEGCHLIMTDDIVMVGDRIYVKATASVMKGVVVIASASAFAREPFEKKGMDASQITGAASSYARKYALNGLFAIDDTKDADAAEPEPPSSFCITPEQALEVSKLITETDSDVIAFCKHFKISCVDELKSKDFERAMFALNKKLEAK